MDAGRHELPIVTAHPMVRRSPSAVRLRVDASVGGGPWQARQSLDHGLVRQTVEAGDHELLVPGRPESRRSARRANGRTDAKGFPVAPSVAVGLIADGAEARVRLQWPGGAEGSRWTERRGARMSV